MDFFNNNNINIFAKSSDGIFERLFPYVFSSYIVEAIMGVIMDNEKPITSQPVHISHWSTPVITSRLVMSITY